LGGFVWSSEDQCLSGRHRSEEFAGGCGIEYEDDGGERVAVCGAGIDDGGLEHTFDGTHGARVEDVAVTMAIFDEELFRASAGGE
jgi:hypothetical protein